MKTREGESELRERVSCDEGIRELAAHWVIRRDRGLTVQEAADFEKWRRADPRHLAALHEAEADWSVLDRMPAPVARRGGRTLIWRCTLAATVAAAGMAASWFLGFPAARFVPDVVSSVHTFAAGMEVRDAALPDGTQVLINAGGVLLESFNAKERTVRLLRGEAHFVVAKNKEWPFVVLAGAARIRAVGTAFNVQLGSEAIDVIVTEGRVRVQTQSAESTVENLATRQSSFGTNQDEPADKVPMLEAGQRATIGQISAAAGDHGAITISRLGPVEIARTLAWQEPLWRLGGSTLAEVAREFERRTGYRLVLADAELATVQVGGFFNPDDVEGFVHLMEQCFGLRAESTGPHETVLRKKR